MKIIFLDLDGVLTNHNTRFRTPDLLCVNHLNEIINKTNAYIVISSTWRKYDSLDKLKDILNIGGFGIDKNRILGITPRLNESHARGKEIQQWLDETNLNIESFVILDDDADMIPNMRHLVQTDTFIGLTQEFVELAIKVLNGELMSEKGSYGTYNI